MNVFDLILGSDFDLVIEDGDFKVDESTRQQQELLLLANKGEIKQYPTSGVGIQSFILDDPDDGALASMITDEFEGDGMSIQKLDIVSATNMQIDAIYNNLGGSQ